MWLAIVFSAVALLVAAAAYAEFFAPRRARAGYDRTLDSTTNYLLLDAQQTSQRSQSYGI